MNFKLKPVISRLLWYLLLQKQPRQMQRMMPPMTHPAKRGAFVGEVACKNIWCDDINVSAAFISGPVMMVFV